MGTSAWALQPGGWVAGRLQAALSAGLAFCYSERAWAGQRMVGWAALGSTGCTQKCSNTGAQQHRRGRGAAAEAQHPRSRLAGWLAGRCVAGQGREAGHRGRTKRGRAGRQGTKEAGLPPCLVVVQPDPVRQGLQRRGRKEGQKTKRGGWWAAAQSAYACPWLAGWLACFMSKWVIAALPAAAQQRHLTHVCKGDPAEVGHQELQEGVGVGWLDGW